MVVRALLPTYTVLVGRKFTPLTVIKRGVVPPVRTVAGERDKAPGTGLLTGNETAAEVPPPGVGLAAANVRLPALTRSQQ